MKSYKQILESSGETWGNPTVSLFKDAKGKDLFAHLLLDTAASLHGFLGEDIMSDKGFWKGKIVQVPKQKMWVQISPNSKFKK